jgi:hypothetical protein
MGGRSAAAKKAPLSAAAAIEANPNVFMIAYIVLIIICMVFVRMTWRGNLIER